jgi:hypothetical protein
MMKYKQRKGHTKRVLKTRNMTTRIFLKAQGTISFPLLQREAQALKLFMEGTANSFDFATALNEEDEMRKKRNRNPKKNTSSFFSVSFLGSSESLSSLDGSLEGALTAEDQTEDEKM